MVLTFQKFPLNIIPFDKIELKAKINRLECRKIVKITKYFCLPLKNGESGTVGIAWIGTICGPQDYQTAVVEYFGNDIKTGEVRGPFI